LSKGSYTGKEEFLPLALLQMMNNRAYLGFIEIGRFLDPFKLIA
jgi:hypothetical protein